MKEIIGNRVGVYRTTMRREVLRLPIPMALVTALAVFLTRRRLDTANMDVYRLAGDALVVWAACCCLVFAGLWVSTRIWKVTLFEGGVRGPTSSLGFQALAWGEISAAERTPLHMRSINPFHAVLLLHASQGPGIWINEPLLGMPEFKEHVRRLAGEDHPFARLLHER